MLRGMNLILIEPEEIRADGTVILRDRRHEHVREVLRAGPGDRLRVGIVNGPQGSGEVLEATERRVVLRIEADGQSLPAPELDLILAMPRPIVLRRVLTQAAIMGIGRLFLVDSARAEKSYFEASLLRPEKYQAVLRHGLEQAVDTWLPEVHVAPRFREFAREVLPGIVQSSAIGLLAHPEAEQGLAQRVQPPLRGRVTLAIGPAGGWQDHEIAALQGSGLVPFSMGPRILRVDTAVTALLAQIDLLRQVGAGADVL